MQEATDLIFQNEEADLDLRENVSEQKHNIRKTFDYCPSNDDDSEEVEGRENIYVTQQRNQLGTSISASLSRALQ